MGPLEAFKLWKLYRDDRAAALREVMMNGELKPGWKTTEFWMTILAQVPAVLGIFIGASNPITLGISAAATVAYTLSRAWSKNNAGAVTLAALQAAADAAKALPQPPAQPPKP